MGKAWIFENENQLKAIFGLEPTLASRMIPCKFWREGELLCLCPEDKIPPLTAAKLETRGIRHFSAKIPHHAEYIDAPWKAFSLVPSHLGDDFGTKPQDCLFACNDHSVATDLVSRLLALGCDRILTGELSDGRVLIRAESAPLFIIWTALDSEKSKVFLECATGVFCPMGKRHPLGDLLTAPEGTWLILADPRGGEFLEKKSLTAFDNQWHLKASPSRHLQALPWKREITIPLRLEKTNLNSGQPSLWRVDEDLIPKFLEWVGKAPEEQICQYEWAALGTNSQDTFLVRPAVPTAQVELPVHTVAYERMHPLEPIYIPVGTRISPPLRVERLLEVTQLSPGTIAWLETDLLHPEKLAQAKTLPASSFRSLESCLEFQLASDPIALNAWSDSIEFKDLEDLIVIPPTQDRDDPLSPIPHQEVPRTPVSPQTTRTRIKESKINPGENKKGRLKEEKASRLPSAEPNISSPGPSHATTLASLALEEWLGIPGPLHSPKRLEAVPTLAKKLEEGERPEDAADALLIEFWHLSPLSNSWSNSKLREVSLLETRSLAIRAGKKAKSIRANPALILEDKDLGGELRAVAARWFAMEIAAKNPKTEAPSGWNQFLFKVEDWLPIRHAWLAWRNWHALTGDIESLGQAHDRLLRRLSGGLQVGRDSPPFLGGKLLREKGGRSDAGNLLETLRDGFSKKLNFGENNQADRMTRSLALALFAAGSLKAGNASQATTWWDQGKTILTKEGQLGKVLMAAIDERLDQIRTGQSTDKSLASFSIEETKTLNPTDRYRIDNLRKTLSFFEPAQTINPFNHFLTAFNPAGGGNPLRERSVAIQNALVGQLPSLLSAGLSDLEALFGTAAPGSQKSEEVDLALQLLQSIQERVGLASPEIALRSLRLGKLVTRRILENADTSRKDQSLQFCLRLLRGALFAAGPWGLREEVDQWLHAALEPDGETPGLFALLVRTGQGRLVGTLLQEMVNRLRAWDMETAGFELVDGLDKVLPNATGEDQLTLGLILAAQLERRGQNARAREILAPCREGIQKAREQCQPLKGQSLDQRLELARGLIMFALESEPAQGQGWIAATADLFPSLMPASSLAGASQVAHLRILKVIETLVLAISNSRDMDARNGWCEEEEAMLRRVILAQGRAVLSG